MEKYKTKIIQADLGIFTHIPAYSDIFKHKHTYPGIIRTYSEPSVTLAYLEPWYIGNTSIFRTRSIFRTVAYSESWCIPEAAVQWCS